MQKNLYYLFIAVLGALIAAYIYCAGAKDMHHMEHSFDHSELKITHAYARVSSPTAKSGAVFFIIENGTEEEAHLMGATSNVTNKAELHTHTAGDDGVMMMGEIQGGVRVAPKGAAMFKRGGKHVMLMGLRKSLNNGDVIPLSLIFEDKTLKLDVIVDNDRKVEDHEMHH